MNNIYQLVSEAIHINEISTNTIWKAMNAAKARANRFAKDPTMKSFANIKNWQHDRLAKGWISRTAGKQGLRGGMNWDSQNVVKPLALKPA